MSEVELPAPKTMSPATERVHAAATSLFSQYGFLATTIRDITGACGITAAAFYNHFESKEAVLYEIITAANTRLAVQLEQLDLDALSPAEALDNLVRTLVTFNLNTPEEARIANREYGFLQASLRDEVVEHRRRVRSLFEDVLIAPEIPRGLLARTNGADDAMEIRLLAISMINLTIASSDWYRSAGPLSIDEVAETYSRLARRMAGIASTAIDGVLPRARVTTTKRAARTRR